MQFITSMRLYCKALVVTTLSLAPLGCRHPHREPIDSAPVAMAPPPDELMPGELVETNEKAFGLTIPEGLKIQKRLYNNVVLIGNQPSTVIVAYVRARVDATISSEPGKTSFIDATMKDPTQGFRGNLRIDVSRRGQTTVLEMWAEEAPLSEDGDSPPSSQVGSIARASQIESN